MKYEVTLDVSMAECCAVMLVDQSGIRAGLCGLLPLSPTFPSGIVFLLCGSESSPRADMISNPVQLQIEKTIWSDSMLEAPDGVLGSDVLYPFFEVWKSERKEKNVICQK